MYCTVNPHCPNCNEDHANWIVGLRMDEEFALKDFYNDNLKADTNTPTHLAPPATYITRLFECPNCHKIFKATIGISKNDLVQYSYYHLY